MVVPSEASLVAKSDKEDARTAQPSCPVRSAGEETPDRRLVSVPTLSDEAGVLV